LSCSSTLDADILLVNGTVYNGVDTLPQIQDIAIKNDKIIFIGNSSEAKIESVKVIDAKGMIVSPGFIDPHTHAEGDVKQKDKSHNLPFLMQGVTTVTIGNDGGSNYPTGEHKLLYEKHGIGTNLVLLVGHGTIRKKVMGKSNRVATIEELNRMKALILQEMNDGAMGMSTGLYYSPGSYSNTEEVIELAKVVAQNNGIYDTHLRDESSFNIGLIAAVQEALEIGKKANLPIHISHIKCLGVDVWNKSDTIIKMINEARNDGQDVSANQYPYEASATSLKAAVVPRWAESGGLDSLFIRYNNPVLKERILKETEQNIKRRGGATKLLVVKADEKSYVGKNVLEIAEFSKFSPEETVFEILKTGQAKVASFNMTEEDILNFMKQDWVVTGSDGGDGHPRKYGTFPRKYERFVLEKKVMSIAEFINGSSDKTAKILKIPNRGQLKVGFYADVIIFDPDSYRETATYTDAFSLAEGVKYSIINGKISIDDGKFTNALNGKVLHK